MASHKFGYSIAVMAIVLLHCMVEVVNAKSGCANFGHSCYGGLGKRVPSDDLIDDPKGTTDTLFGTPSKYWIPPILWNRPNIERSALMRDMVKNYMEQQEAMENELE